MGTDATPGTAVVIGASMAGLCAARVLAPQVDRVVVLDRDTLPDGPDWRGQVPQGRQPHLLLVAGARLLEQWFPGLGEELAERGAVDVDICGDAFWFQVGGPARRPRSDLRGPAMSRPLLEWTIRRRVAELPNVTIRAATAADGMDVDPTTGRVRAVRLDDGTAIGCDLLVDASGRQARSLAWLAGAGFPAPPVSSVEVDMRYVSRTYRRQAMDGPDWKVAGLIGEPHTKRVAMALPLEDERWIVALAGFNGEQPPTGHPEMVDFARSLGSPAIAEIMTGEPLSDPVTYRFRANQRRHVERLRRFPLGWLLIGDAVCSFDPIYGQGMTSALQQAAVLADCLDRSGRVDRALSRRYFRAAGRTVATPWSTAVGGDFSYPGTTGKKPFGTDLFNRYYERMVVAGQHDDRIVVRINEVMAMLRRPEALLSPPIMWRVWRGARRGPVGETRPVGATSRS